MISLVCNAVFLVWVFKHLKQKLHNEAKPKLVINYVDICCNHKLLFYSNDTKQASALQEPSYELLDKSSDVKLENNPAYSVSAAPDISQDHHYDVIPSGHNAKAK